MTYYNKTHKQNVRDFLGVNLQEILKEFLQDKTK